MLDTVCVYCVWYECWIQCLLCGEFVSLLCVRVIVLDTVRVCVCVCAMWCVRVCLLAVCKGMSVGYNVCVYCVMWNSLEIAMVTLFCSICWIRILPPFHA